MSDSRYPKVPTAQVASSDAKLPPASALFAREMVRRGEPRPRTVAADCYQDLWLTVFFDGTGNNRDIDVPTFEHSNVARLFRAMKLDSIGDGRYTFYVPGLGTPFREIGDPGGALGKGVAVGGEARIQWAMEKVEFRIKEAALKAWNPVNKVRSINVAVFGFSRGAATARAFARRFADKCEQSDGKWLWKDGKYPTRLYFMGLFDTVAAVGTPMGMRKYADTVASVGDASPALHGLLMPVEFIMGTADGHGAWASDLRIPPMVERCVHFCSAHELRNSFPLDTTIDCGKYPPNCQEAFYPGVHSNVGGGYRPGEGARNANRFALLSQIPLNAMYQEAVKANVPLRSLEILPDNLKEDFLPLAPDAVEARGVLIKRFNHYMNAVGWGGKSVGETVKAHMKMYFRWRIIHVGRKILAKAQHKPGWEEQRLIDYDKQLASERAAKDAELQRREREYIAALNERDRAAGRLNLPTTDNLEGRRAAYDEAVRHAEEARWAAIEQQARVATLPESAPDLEAALEKYDKQFLEDSDRVRKADRKTLTPFETVLCEAWDTEPLKDPEILAFFDDYVTDSLAGFDKDRTRATEYRWLYQGGDDTVMYGDDDAEAQKRRAEEAELEKKKRQWELESREYSWTRS